MSEAVRTPEQHGRAREREGSAAWNGAGDEHRKLARKSQIVCRGDYCTRSWVPPTGFEPVLPP